MILLIIYKLKVSIMTKVIKNVAMAILVLVVSSCAQVPKESVKLSATVGRDMVEMEKSHLAFVNIYYDNLIAEINYFIDNVYLPYQVRNTLNDADTMDHLVSTIESARQPDDTGNKQKDAVQGMSIYLEELYREVESYRQAKLNPIKKQKADLVSNIEESYGRIHYANSIVTGHLASVVKVHDTQNELLADINLEDLRAKIGVMGADISAHVSELTIEAKSEEAKIDNVVKKFNELIDKINK